MPRQVKELKERSAPRIAPVDLECRQGSDAGAKIQSRLSIEVFTTNGKGRVWYLPDPPGFWRTTRTSLRPVQHRKIENSGEILSNHSMSNAYAENILTQKRSRC
jgi:hypothetical protein